VISSRHRDISCVASLDDSAVTSLGRNHKVEWSPTNTGTQTRFPFSARRALRRAVEKSRLIEKIAKVAKTFVGSCRLRGAHLSRSQNSIKLGN